jgi:hypothetical protein
MFTFSAEEPDICLRLVPREPRLTYRRQVQGLKTRKSPDRDAIRTVYPMHQPFFGPKSLLFRP